ncbi:MAG: exodeoxyribonuclease VII small subunit [Firmicutes bacterium]|nr:exodeoxyribonuclease VII small subunit [Bacillota bacterium]
MAGHSAVLKRLRRKLLLKDKKSAEKFDKLSYEEALKKLEVIVSKLEDAEISLEDSIEAFQEGIALSGYCREKLAEIEFKVEHLLKEEQQVSAGEDSVVADEAEDSLF